MVNPPSQSAGSVTSRRTKDRKSSVMAVAEEEVTPSWILSGTLDHPTTTPPPLLGNRSQSVAFAESNPSDRPCSLDNSSDSSEKEAKGMQKVIPNPK